MKESNTMQHPPAQKDPNCRIGWVTNKKTGSKFYNLPPHIKHPLQETIIGMPI